MKLQFQIDVWQVVCQIGITLIIAIPYLLYRREQERSKMYKEAIAELKETWDEDVQLMFNAFKHRLEYFIGDGIYVPKGEKQSILMPRERTNIPASLRYEIMKRDDFKCQLCGYGQAMGVMLEVDHKLPVSKGGTNEQSNLWALCDTCNSGKSDRILADWMKTESWLIDGSWFTVKSRHPRFESMSFEEERSEWDLLKL